MFKGLGLSISIITLLLVGVPMLGTYAMMGPDEYARQCKMTIVMPCFGMKEVSP